MDKVDFVIYLFIGVLVSVILIFLGRAAQRLIWFIKRKIFNSFFNSLISEIPWNEDFKMSLFSVLRQNEDELKKMVKEKPPRVKTKKD